uniref:Uncharacterized protein n=1 Tax=viral metagenome TaxID=1070528 RepID=A0A6M3JLP5_9ZZZZ
MEIYNASGLKEGMSEVVLCISAGAHVERKPLHEKRIWLLAKQRVVDVAKAKEATVYPGRTEGNALYIRYGSVCAKDAKIPKIEISKDMVEEGF